MAYLVYVHCSSAYITCFSSGVITPAAFSGVVLAMAVAMLGGRDGGLEGGASCCCCSGCCPNQSTKMTARTMQLHHASYSWLSEATL